MLFETHIPIIEQYHQLLESSKPSSLVQIYVLSILEQIKDNPNSFNLAICKDTPFFSEFLATIQRASVHEEDCFALLECLIIFCREKQLRLGSKDDMPLVERNILTFYEESELWHINDGTLLNEWYWHHLPKSCTND